MEVQEAIFSRRSIRNYQSIPVEREKWLQIVYAGNLAPCAGNIQSWRFVVIDDDDIKEKVAHLCYQQEWMCSAPLLIVVVNDEGALKPHYPDYARDFAVANGAAAMQNMILMAQSLGLGSCWVGVSDHNRLGEQIQVGEGQFIGGVLALGYVNEQVPTPPKQDIKRFLSLNRLGNKYDDFDRVLGTLSKVLGKRAKKTGKFISNIIPKK